MSKEFWNQRFSAEAYVFGKEPNVFFKSVIDSLPPGRIFIPGAGEGRDAVYAATKGWDVYCADLSEAGSDKAMRLAAEYHVTIHYEVCDLAITTFPEEYFDAVGSIYCHLPSAIRLPFYREVENWLKNNGVFFLEAFTPRQLDLASGGPKDPDMLMTEKKLAEEVGALKTQILKEEDILLAEGAGHAGRANVVRYIGIKTKNQ